MSALSLHHHGDASEIRRYGAAAVTVVVLHLALIIAAARWYKREGSAGISIPAILVDLAPASAALQIQTQDIPVGPVSERSDGAPPEPPPTELVEQLPPTPTRPDPVVAAPPKAETKPRPDPVKPQPAREQAKASARKPPAPATASPKADRIAADAPAQASGASAAGAAAAYNSILASHLQRFKQYPDSARAKGEQGTTSLNFTVTRTGQVTGSRLARSSGFASLDQATMALIQRAQPLPAFPPEMREASKNFTVPFSFSMR